MGQEAYAVTSYTAQTTSTTTIVITWDVTDMDTASIVDTDFEITLDDLTVITAANFNVAFGDGTGAGGLDQTTITLTANTMPTSDTPDVELLVGQSVTSGGGAVTLNGVVNVESTDGVAPVISAVSPTASSSIDDVSTGASDVSFTFSEAVTSGSVVLTNTGGTAGGGGTCTLQGTALNTGAHANFPLTTSANTCVAAITPSEDGIYTFTFNAQDGAGNSATAITRTLVTFDAVGPVVASTTTNGGGSGCQDCEAPTLGIDKNGKRHVSNGFTYNGHSVDVERFFTPYPLIKANVGQTNKADFKIYENEGPDNIKHFSFAFGLGNDQIISESKAMIELDIDWDGTETVTITDPENVLDNVKVETSTVSCDGDERVSCMGVTVYHTFRASLDFNIVATDVWDNSRNSWQNYYNHGIEVVGKSLNPAKEHDGINKGHIYHLTETSKTTAVDEFGNSWTLQYGLWKMEYVDNSNNLVTLFLKNMIPSNYGIAGSDQYGNMYYLTETSKTTAVDGFGNTWSLESGQWTMDSIYSKIILDSTPMGGYARDDSKFNMYKYGQALLAENKLSLYR